MQNSSNQTVKNKGIYLLPNLFTTAGLFSGFYAVIASMNANFEAAAIAIFIAMICDGLDGRVARLTNTQSDFGAEYDSMADMVSFGMAPALLAYNWALADLGKIGWLVAFIYCAGAALRLARFNAQVGVADKRYFQGLASPAAAAVIAGSIWLGNQYSLDGRNISWIAALVTAATGLLMVSNFRYHSFKEIDWRGKVNFIVILLVVGVFVVVSVQPALILCVGFYLYAISGPIITIRTVRKLKVAHVVGDDVAASVETNSSVQAAAQTQVVTDLEKEKQEEHKP
ncbi:CDP-diacylglycerol--serine O-phosphatidyltransferase [Shewanella baltica]|uniref:CDP-diacylglycerol--serine O-phosphatidyltransferase n=1 Tax=Shewanella baltica TaxID=62322 RepID=UPI00217DE828|nr:CDP-diacylglycerol--serine O-phosphatidyltransferase [Shewanella baltica]MCS6127955.1 CDP-diacylglycerol--serine O-phosphatidyltransferase [Shewanella baltica]MCS6140028.1 CDP-diacylglycerol--serine O-phosphatidyltransferase [Shewanella baltica]MCS6146169.1 CDP-diacylglycerol--serine O-phosphatidyltransferase [Shewanella baltica]MCS6170699.1 CDP-diacylglycerol--serine O-phosphatidyltransferase [Shewanella baltica]MCS6187756.1 CDP-diacylglycerol--serine O-phosphatidyltransferase [Shewanella 